MEQATPATKPNSNFDKVPAAGKPPAESIPERLPVGVAPELPPPISSADV